MDPTPMDGQRRSFLYPYVAAGSVAGIVVLAVILVTGDLSPVWRDPATFFTLLALLVVGENIRVIIRRGNGNGGEISVSTPFVFAILLTSGVTAGLLALVTASVTSDLFRRKAWFKTVFNGAQYVLTMAGCGLVMSQSNVEGLLNDPATTVRDIGWVLAGGLVFFVLNNTLPATAAALEQRVNPLSVLRRDLSYQVATAGMLVVTAPIVVVVAEFSLLLLPILLLPALAVAWSTSMSLANEWQSLHDSLTELPNRALFHASVKEATADGSPAGVMLVDLDHFKEVNDTLGHRTGDKLLVEVAARLRGGLGPDAVVARLGGDEFALLLPGAEPEQAEAAAQAVLDSMHRPFVVDDFMLSVEASIGVATYPLDGEDSGTLLRCADVAMYMAKESRKGYERYTPERDQHSRQRLALMGQVRNAIEAGEFVLHYQPKLDLITNEVVGVEALVRWQHPELGLLPPGEFIPQLEKTIHIAAFTSYVVKLALEQVARWRRSGLELTVAVNVSVTNLLDAAFAQHIGDLIEAAGVPAGLLEVEITESTIMADPDRAQLVLNALADLGVSLSIDDFGTGYSSLAYLKQLPVETIKIDRSFVMHMATDVGDQRIVQSTIGLAGNLGLSTVAEGVEDETALEMLRSLGCDMVQGYYIARPLPPAELVQFMLARRQTVEVQPAPVVV